MISWKGAEMGYQGLIKKQKEFFKTGKTKKTAFRLFYLRKLLRWIDENESHIIRALNQDLGKSETEGYMTEIGMVKEEIRHTMRHLASWAKPRYVKTPASQFPSASFIYREPYGVVLIMAPWNYPFQLTMAPLIGAIAAGNCAVLKPSAYSVRTSEIIKRMIKEVFPSCYVTVITGGREENEALLNEKFDYIFFTGSPRVGKSVMEKAARYLTPVSLELGGKSPCIVDETADLKMAAKRIVWGKFLNSGQTCVAPDYLLVQHSVKRKLLHYMKRQIQKMYGMDPISNPEYPTIINQRHFRRVCGLINPDKVVYGGKSDRSALKIEPTIMDGVTWDDAVMKEEIFGPVLPVMTYYDLKEAAAVIDAQPKPLALYLFTKDKKKEAYIVRRLSYGGGCINDTVVHLATPYLPFGGVGQSGMGKYHGKASFDTFTHEKSILKKSVLVDIPFRYPPFRDHLNLIKKFM